MEHLEPGDLRIRSWGNVADGVTFTSVFQPGQVLFGKRRAYQRKVAVADFTGVCSGDIYVLETKDPQVLPPKLLPFICQTDAFFEHAVGTSAGSLSPRTNWTSLANFEFSIPSSNEMPKVLEGLTALQEATNCLLEAHLIASRELTNIRDRMLWEGGLGEFEDSQIGPIPRGWQATQIGNMVDFQGGSQPPASTFEFKAKDTNIRLIQIRDYKSSDFLTYIPRSLARKFCNSDDVMIGRYGPPVFQILRGLEGAYNVALIKAVPKEGLSKGYLFHFLKEKSLLAMIEGLSRRTCGQAGVDMDRLKRYPLPLPPIDVQARLAQLFDSMEVAVEAFRSRIESAASLREQFMERLTGGPDVQ